MKIFKIYKITNLITNKIYIGQTSTSIKERWCSHNYISNSCSYIHNSIKKYGKVNFKIEWIASALSETFVDDLEDFFIKELNSLSPNGYNLKLAGSHPTMCDESKIKMSKTRTKLYSQMTKEERKDKTKHLLSYIEDKKRPIIGINEKFETIEFSNICEAFNQGFYPVLGEENNNYFSQGYLFFDKGKFSYNEMIDKFKSAVKIKNINIEKGGEKRSKSLRKFHENNPKNEITAIHPKTKDIKHFLNARRASEQGFSVSDICNSLKRNPDKPVRSKGYHFFYTNQHTIEEMFELAEKTEEIIENRYKEGRKKSYDKNKERIEAQKISLIGINPKTLDYRIFESWSEASREKYSSDAIRRGIRGEKRTSKKLHFQYFTKTPEEHIEITKELYNPNT